MDLGGWGVGERVRVEIRNVPFLEMEVGTLVTAGPLAGAKQNEDKRKKEKATQTLVYVMSLHTEQEGRQAC